MLEASSRSGSQTSLAHSESQPLVPAQLSREAANKIFDAKDIANIGIPTYLATVVGGFAAYGFMKYSQGFLEPHIGPFSYAAGPLCGIPIMLLAGSAGGKAIAGLISDPVESAKAIMKSLISLGLWNRSDLWGREINNFCTWGLLQIANGLSGTLKLVTTPLSVIASDALNYEKSQTWASTGPNTASSTLMNAFYLNRSVDGFLDWLAACFEDEEPEKRANILRLLTGVKKELPKFIQQQPQEFLTWFLQFVECKTDLDKLKKLAELQTRIENPDPRNYDNATSIMGISFLFPALIFTLPLFRAGQKARAVFAHTNLLDAVLKYLPWPSISGSSMLVNMMINGVNAYNFGADLGEMFDAIFHGEAKTYFASLHVKDYVRLVVSGFCAILSAIAQMGSAAANPLIAALTTAEIIAVGFAAFALYCKSSNNNGQRLTNFIERWQLRSVKDFQAKYRELSPKKQTEMLETLMKVVVEQVEGVEAKIKRMPYDSSEDPYEDIQRLFAVPALSNVVESLPTPQPSRWGSWCNLFRNGRQGAETEVLQSGSIPSLAAAVN